MMTSSKGSSTRIWGYPAYLLFVSACSLLLCDVSAVEIGGVCTNPEEVQGTCIKIRSCPSILSALQTKPLPPATVDFLRRSQCGFQEGGPLVCCPPDSHPPSANASRPRENEDVSHHPNLELLSKEICGPVVSNLIGRGLYLMELPWMALLEYTTQSGSPFKCGGSVINERYVLTAAQCVTGLQSNLSLVSVRLGEHNLTSPIDCEGLVEYEECAPPPQDIPVEKVTPHPRFVGKPDFQYDIALVRLARPANFSNGSVRPICLPIEPAQQTENLDEKHVVISGWGATMMREPSPELSKWSERVMSYSECSGRLRRLVAVSEDSQICAGGGGMDSCSHSDSGGPLTKVFSGRSSEMVQHGIFSYGPLSCDSSDHIPGVYTRVGHFIKWILDTIEP